MCSTTDRSDGGALSLRPAQHSDLTRITTMLDLASRRWVGRATTTEEVHDRLNTPNCDLDRDTVIVLDASETVVGFGHIWPAQPAEIRCFARTHPGYRGEGVGTALQRHLIGRALDIAGGPETSQPPTLTTTTWPDDLNSGVLLAAVGYEPARYYLKMVMDLAGGRLDVPPVPDGFLVREFVDGADDEALFAAFVEAFHEHWGWERPDAVDWWRERREAESAEFDPGLWLVALEGDLLAGFAIARIQQDSDGNQRGYIGDLGVRPAQRGKGLGETLLARSLATLQGRGLTHATLDVDTANTTGALRLYTKIGMESQPSFTIWSRPLTKLG